MLPLLILVCLGNTFVFTWLLDDCSLAFFGIVVVVIFCEIVVVVPSSVGVVVVVVPIASTRVLAFSVFTVIPVVRVVVVVGVAPVSVLLAAPVLVVPLVSVAVATILTRSGVASKLRLTTRSLGATAIWRDIII